VSPTPQNEKSAIKTAVRLRDGMRCTQCGLSNADHQKATGKSLHVHRLQPGSAYTVQGCISLCASCHGQAPRRAPGEQDREQTAVLVALDPDMYDTLKAIAQANGRPVAWEIRRALQAHINTWRSSQQGHS
jgi:5-methylcytosine-specific restriction endonuclease McrA